MRSSENAKFIFLLILNKNYQKPKQSPLLEHPVVGIKSNEVPIII